MIGKVRQHYKPTENKDEIDSYNDTLSEITTLRKDQTAIGKSMEKSRFVEKIPSSLIMNGIKKLLPSIVNGDRLGREKKN